MVLMRFLNESSPHPPRSVCDPLTGIFCLSVDAEQNLDKYKQNKYNSTLQEPLINTKVIIITTIIFEAEGYPRVRGQLF